MYLGSYAITPDKVADFRLEELNDRIRKSKSNDTFDGAEEQQEDDGDDDDNEQEYEDNDDIGGENVDEDDTTVEEEDDELDESTQSKDDYNVIIKADSGTTISV